MNREVHYIFSIQTQDYLKTAWEERKMGLPNDQNYSSKSGRCQRKYKERFLREEAAEQRAVLAICNTQEKMRSKGKQRIITTSCFLFQLSPQRSYSRFPLDQFDGNVRIFSEPDFPLLIWIKHSAQVEKKQLLCWTLYGVVHRFPN